MAQIVTDNEIVSFIQHYHEINGWSPSVREIVAGVGYGSTSTVQNRLLQLNDAGRIVYKGVRQIKVVE